MIGSSRVLSEGSVDPDDDTEVLDAVNEDEAAAAVAGEVDEMEDADADMDAISKFSVPSFSRLVKHYLSKAAIIMLSPS